MERVCVADVFKQKGTVVVSGWVHDVRDLSKVRFIVLKDSTGRVQVTGIAKETDPKVFELMKSISRESVVVVEGTLQESKQAPGGKEILPSVINVIAAAQHPLPLDVSDHSKTELSKRLDYRFLDLHREKIAAIFKIQSTVSTTFRNHFIKKGFVEFQPPSIIGSSSEGGTELFTAQYFEKKAFLAQSPQLYKQMAACSPLEKVMTITPVWRAEKHNTIRHLNECRQMDIEMAFVDQQMIMKQLSEVVVAMVKQVLADNKRELELLGVELLVPKIKYLSYDETAQLLGIKSGEDLSSDNERELHKKFPNTIVFVHSWPTSIKPFYIMPQGADPKARLSEGFDAIYMGMEITSGGQRIHIPQLLEKRLKAKGLNPKDFKHYVDSFRHGAPPHGGWSIGLERFTQAILQLDNIREACMFPRDRDRLTP